MEITGRIKMIGVPQEISPTFRKREVVITTEEQYPQHILIEFTQNNCELLNNYQPNQLVRVNINIRGREWRNPQGEIRYFNTIQGWRIDSLEQNGGYQQPQQGFSQPQQGFSQPQQGFSQPQQGFSQPQQGFSQPQQGFSQPQQGFSQPNNDFPPAPDFSSSQENPDDLPF